MKKMLLVPKLVMVLLFSLLILTGVFAQEAVGRIVYIEGIVDLHREGELLELFDSDVGMDIYNFDLVETGGDGLVEIEMVNLTNQGSMIRVRENTAFYFDSSSLGGASQNNLTMLSGSVQLKIQKLAGKENMAVSTESAVMGVRGTEFTVTEAPEASVLVACTAGAVECADDENNKLTASAGRIVEKRPDEPVKGIAVDPGDEELYLQFWWNQREEVFKAGAVTFVKGYSHRYNQMLPLFEEAYRNLYAIRDVLETHGNEGASEALGATGTMVQVKSEVSDEIFAMRSVFPAFEEIFYTVQLLERYHCQGIGVTEIERKYSSSDFFQEFAAEKETLKQKMSYVRYLFRMYTNISKAAGGGYEGSLFDSVGPLGTPPSF
ncbi:MAG: FecR domain-containing protein [Spirochaetales bacterium]|nr:FecR domain-containing protein [Spirochaetales bacterium]